jgi:hypothetical protein
VTLVEDWGSFRVVVAGVDVSFYRNAPVQVTDWHVEEPFGCGPAHIVVPKIGPKESVPAWMVGGSAVDIVRLHPDGSTRTVLWSGEISMLDGSITETDAGWVIDCIGDLWAAGYQTSKIWYQVDPVDIGTYLPLMLNRVVSRRTHTIPYVTTGIVTTQIGSRDGTVMDIASAELAMATDDNGVDQWTIARTEAPRTYEMRLKDRATIHATIAAGARGVTCRLGLDSTQAVNVIYGHGQKDGKAWAGWVFPNLGYDTAPAYPNADAGQTLSIGTTDGDTDSGNGVSTWQGRAADLGYTIAVDGVYSSSDAAIARQIQARYGITVDGIVGPQTWSATFAVGSNAGNLDDIYRAPIWQDNRVVPRLANADGSDAGANGTYDPARLRIEQDIAFGDGISKAQAARSAAALGLRGHNPGWVGTITLRQDPEELGRFSLREGTNVMLRGWEGEDVRLHISGIDFAPGDASVTLTVDQLDRDAMTLAAIIQRDEASKRLIDRRPGVPDTVNHTNAFDSESAAGIIPRHALFAGLWDVIHIPVSLAGAISTVDVRTSSPVSKFCMAIFAAPITAADLIGLGISGPLAAATDGYGPFDRQADRLRTEFGLIEAWGGPSQAAGYYPGYETSPHTGTATPVTGRLKEDAGWTYNSARPPWVWVATFSPVSCFVKGRLYPAPLLS